MFPEHLNSEEQSAVGACALPVGCCGMIVAMPSHAIGGWTTTGIGHAYGKGYSVEILAKWMQKIEC